MAMTLDDESPIRIDSVKALIILIATVMAVTVTLIISVVMIVREVAPWEMQSDAQVQYAHLQGEITDQTKDITELAGTISRVDANVQTTSSSVETEREATAELKNQLTLDEQMRMKRLSP
jgi:peptidoglycan hydrolase CwlO-like protein